MSVHSHLHMLRGGVTEWNRWREANPTLAPDLSGFDFSKPLARGHNTASWPDMFYEDLNRLGNDLTGVNFSGANLAGTRLKGWLFDHADLRSAKLTAADLTQADLRDSCLNDADLSGANLTEADFCHATLQRANLQRATLVRTDFYYADLTGADLRAANGSTTMFVGSNLSGANLEGCRVYGADVWKVQLADSVQRNLIITPDEEPVITVDNLEIAQFIYLLLNNEKIRHVIDTITSKVVLILGRFTPERKAVLDSIRAELRNRNYLPVLFDFDKPSSKTTLETVSTLAHMARFVVADLTDAKSVLQELQAVVPSNPSVPVQPVMLNSQSEPGMFDFFRMFPWVLPAFLYEDQDGLLAAITDKVIGPAEKKAKEQTGR